MAKDKMIKLPHLKDRCASQVAYVQNLLGQHPKKYSNDFVEQIIENKRKELKNGVQKNKV